MGLISETICNIRPTSVELLKIAKIFQGTVYNAEGMRINSTGSLCPQGQKRVWNFNLWYSSDMMNASSLFSCISDRPNTSCTQRPVQLCTYTNYTVNRYHCVSPPVGMRYWYLFLDYVHRLVPLFNHFKWHLSPVLRWHLNCWIR